jgi:hypothetical protein
MKTFRILITIAFACLIGSPSMRAADATFNSVTLGWSANAEPDLAGYRLYFSQSTNEWTHVKPVGLVTEATVELPTPGEWFFILTAKNQADLESLPSNLVRYVTPTGPSRNGTMRILAATATQVSTVTTSTNLILVP